MNNDKPRIEPNFSFDLCRLACSIHDEVIDSDDEGDSDEDEWSVELVDEDITDDALRLAAATAASKGDVETMKAQILGEFI